MRHVYAPSANFYFFIMHKPATLKRRSHVNRTAAKKNVQITDRDILDIFEPLSRHAQLTTRQLVAFGSRYPTITKGRLGELWHATGGERSHWLHRVNEDLLFAKHMFVEDFHRLGLEAETLLCAKHIIPNEDWVATSRIGGNSRSPSRVVRLVHDHLASDIAIDIEIGARHAGVSYRSHVEILRDAPDKARNAKKPLRIPVTLDGQRTFVEPDALFEVGGRVFALESDKGTESIRGVIVPKILAYREIVADHIIDEYLGIDNLTMLFATPSAARMRNVMNELAKIAFKGKSKMFAFRAEPAFDDFMQSAPPSGRYATTPWARVGYDDLIPVDSKRDA